MSIREGCQGPCAKCGTENGKVAVPGRRACIDNRERRRVASARAGSPENLRRHSDVQPSAHAAARGRQRACAVRAGLRAVDRRRCVGRRHRSLSREPRRPAHPPVRYPLVRCAGAKARRQRCAQSRSEGSTRRHRRLPGFRRRLSQRSILRPSRKPSSASRTSSVRSPPRSIICKRRRTRRACRT